jgi:hypothetical protein
VTGNQRAIGGVVAAAALIAAVIARYGTQEPPAPVPADLMPERRTEVRSPTPAHVEAAVMAAPSVAAPDALAPALPCCMKMSWQFGGTELDLADEAITFTLRASGLVVATETRAHTSGRVSDQSFDVIVPRSQFYSVGWYATLERSGGRRSDFGMPTIHGFGGVDESGNLPAPPPPPTAPGRRRAVTP